MGLSKRATLKKEKIEFDERTHTYSRNGREYESVTTFIGRVGTKDFKDVEFVASAAKAKSNKGKGKGIKEADRLRRYWRVNGQRAANIGSAAHAYFEMLYLLEGTGEVVNPLTGYEVAAKTFYETLKDRWTIVEVEGRVHDDEYGLAGHYDLLIENKKTRELRLVDFKTYADPNKEIETEGLLREYFGRKLTKLELTSVQLSIYNRVGDLRVPPTNRFVINFKATGEYDIYTHGRGLVEVEALVDELMKLKKQEIK